MIRVKNQNRKQVIDLDGSDGNAYVLMGIARSCLLYTSDAADE